MIFSRFCHTASISFISIVLLLCLIACVKEESNNVTINNLPPPHTHYDSVMRSIQRLGLGSPRQSIISYKRAYDEGFRILLCDLLFTKDNIPVCFHDSYIGENQTYVRYKDGSEVQMYPEIGSRDSIHNLTYDELNEKYDFGIYGGYEYKDTKLLKFEDILKFVRDFDVELYVEVKEMNKQQAYQICRQVKKIGIESKVSWAGNENMKYIVDNNPLARVSTMPYQITDDDIVFLLSLKTGRNKVFFFGWNETILDESIVKKLYDNEIQFEMGTIDDEIEILNYLKQGVAYQYCTGIESNTIIAGKVIYENSQNNDSN